MVRRPPTVPPTIRPPADVLPLGLPGAQAFVETYYAARNDRKLLGAFYASNNPKYVMAGTPVSITVNGSVTRTPADYEALLDAQAPTGNAASRVRYDVESFDAHVLNPTFRAACPQQLLDQPEPRGRGAATAAAAKASILVHVAGSVMYGAGKDATRGGFSELFYLVPNWDALGGTRGAPRGQKSWLILSQNFRSL